jgi:hypothetical protein
MKKPAHCLLIGLLGSAQLGVFSAWADLEVSASVRIHATADFHAPLSAHGAWIEVGNHGRCWRPAQVAVEWRPYCHGHWVWTDCGWYWVSDEPWAWACYHYGAWVYDSRHGWLWVPGIEWAPAWVTWRVGGGYCGWAPLAPRGIVVAPRSFVFVEVHRFHEPVKPATVIVNNTTIINKTTEHAGLKRETRNFDSSGPQKVMVNEGPGLQVIEKATGKKVRQVPIREAAVQTPVPAEMARKTSDSPKKEKSSAAQDPQPSPPERSKKSIRPDTEKKPSREEIGSAPQRPPSPDGPPDNASKPSKGKGGGKGRGKGKD